MFSEVPIKIDKDDVIKTSEIVNGYFYIIFYDAILNRSHNDGFDKLPIIYCVAPDERNINNFWAINFHHFEPAIKEYIINRMIKFYNITDGEDKRVIIPPEALNKIYTNIGTGLRCYNRKGVKDSYRIKNSAILKYMQVSPEFFIKTDQTVENDLNLTDGNKGF